eukprot:451085-Pyramimonas_sp.AAC.1
MRRHAAGMWTGCAQACGGPGRGPTPRDRDDSVDYAGLVASDTRIPRNVRWFMVSDARIACNFLDVGFIASNSRIWCI